ncbi:MAG: di-heme oxidoredictase family protein [Alphaproteobacteria bacterium]
MARRFIYRAFAFAAALLATPALAMTTENGPAHFAEDGTLVRPADYREWVFLGAKVMANDQNYGETYAPGIHATYMDPGAFAHWKKTGEFRDGTVLVRETAAIGSTEFMSANGYFPGEFDGLQAMVKAPDRFPDTRWGFFAFGKPPYAERVPPALGLGETDCAGCHTDADTDWVFTRFYPVLNAAAPNKKTEAQKLFERNWTPATADLDSVGDGLGPLFNARSCEACHPQGGRGKFTFRDDGVIDGDGLLLKAGLGKHGDPIYGMQIQNRAITGLKGEGIPAVRFTEVTDATGTVLRKPLFELRQPAYGTLNDKTVLAGRVAQAVRGNGALERVPVAHLERLSDAQDADGDGISGRLNRYRLDLSGKTVVGRYGWKAGQWSLQVQTAKALRMDMGLSTRLMGPAWGDCTSVQRDCFSAVHGEATGPEGREVGSYEVDLITRHVAALAAPPRRGENRQGEKLFRDSGCAACHVQSLPTDDGDPIAAYSDLLLHDMGEGLSDGLIEGAAGPREWRTAPLMGLGRLMADSAPLLHDGRALNAHEAILWHDGEGRRAADAYRDLDKNRRAALLEFLETL